MKFIQRPNMPLISVFFLIYKEFLNINKRKINNNRRRSTCYNEIAQGRKCKGILKDEKCLFLIIIK